MQKKNIVKSTQREIYLLATLVVYLKNYALNFNFPQILKVIIFIIFIFAKKKIQQNLFFHRLSERRKQRENKI